RALYHFAPRYASACSSVRLFLEGSFEQTYPCYPPFENPSQKRRAARESFLWFSRWSLHAPPSGRFPQHSCSGSMSKSFALHECAILFSFPFLVPLLR